MKKNLQIFYIFLNFSSPLLNRKKKSEPSTPKVCFYVGNDNSLKQVWGFFLCHVFETKKNRESLSIKNLNTLSFILIFWQILPKSEFNAFEPRLKSAQKPVSIKSWLESWKIEYKFKWNQPYLSSVLNSSRGSVSLNSASVC